MQRIMTFHFFFACLFLKSNSFSACSWCFTPGFVRSSFHACGQRDAGWGCLLLAALGVQVAWWPGPDPTSLPFLVLPGARQCAVLGELLCARLPWVALSPIYPLSGESIKVCFHFLTEAEGEFWEWDVEIQRCISERGRKKKLLAVIPTLLVFPFFKPR